MKIVTDVSICGRPVRAGAAASGAASQIISALTVPALGPLADGETVQDALSAGAMNTANYTSTEATITDVSASVTINGAAGLLTDAVSFQDVVNVILAVTDSAANMRAFNAGSQTVAGIAPVALAAPTLSNNAPSPEVTTTITEGSYSGPPAPTVTGVLTLNGVDVTADMVGLDYTIPAGTVGQVLEWSETASNGIAPDAQQSVNATVREPVTTTITTIQADGWRATDDAPPVEYDPVGAPVTLTVTRQGFDTTGAAVPVDDVVTVMKRVREPYPNQGTLTASDAALSDFVYAGDTIAGVTNDSTRAHPQPICYWLDHDLQRAVGQSYTARLAVAHHHARQGRPVAAVKFIATDGVTSVEQTVSAMTSVAYASGLSVPCFEAALDLSALMADTLVTIDAVVFPWVGAAFQASVDGSPYPSINFTTMRVLNDAAYGTAYAYVDATNGSDATGVVSETPATAQAGPYATIDAAASAVQSFNNATFGRNSASGGIVRLEPGTHTQGDFSSVAVTDIPLVVEAADPAQKASTIWQDGGANNADINPDLLKVRNVTLQATDDFAVRLFSNNAGAGSSNMLVLDGCSLRKDPAKSSFWAAWINAVGRFWAIEVDSDATSAFNVFSSLNTMINQIGCSGRVGGGGVYNAAGCRGEIGYGNNGLGPGSDREVANGQFFGHHHLTLTTNGRIMNFGQPVGPRGLAVVGSVLEFTGSLSSNTLWVNADGDTKAVENVVVQHVTSVGERINALYNDAGFAAKSGQFRNSAFEEWNSKSDVFATDGAYVGNWPVIHHVGSEALGFLTGSASADTFGAGSWLGEVQPLGSVTGTSAAPLNPDWADDASADGSGLGGGDYTPGTATELPTIPAGRSAYPFDLKGNAIPDDGTAFVGAAQAV